MTDLQRIPRLMPKNQAHPADSLAAALGADTGAPVTAPAHPFDPATGSGIVWNPTTLELWLHGARRDVADHATATAEDCWHDLAFVAAFPTVTHWWFGSSWTQRVRATQTARRPDGTRLVWFQAVQEDADELLWAVAADDTASGPLPEYAGGAINVVLHARLGMLARLVLAGQIAVAQWAVVTSLVAAAALPALLDEQRRAALLDALVLP